MNKKEDSEMFTKYDLNTDGDISEEEIDKVHRIKRFENEDVRSDSQRKMTWISLGGMLSYPIIVVLCSFYGFSDASKILGDMAPTYFVSVAGIVSVFFGSEAYKNSR
jgi:hypothetical protein